MARANLCGKKINETKTQQAGILRYRHHPFRKNFTQRTDELKTKYKRKQTKVKKKNSKNINRRWTKLKESFTRCCYNMYNAFHPIDDRVLMRVLSIVIIIMCVCVCVDGFGFALNKKAREKEEKKL